MREREPFLCPFCGAPYRELIPAGTVQVKCRYCGAIVLVPPHLGGSVQRCPNHPETLVGSLCTDCGKSYCDHCLHVIEIPPSQAQAGYPKYSYVCPNCLKRRQSKEKEGAYAGFFFLFLLGVFFMFIPEVGIMLGVFYIFLAFIPALVLYKRKSLGPPTVREVMEKMAEMAKRTKKTELAKPLSMEEIYEKLMDIYRYTWGPPALMNQIEIRMEQGLSREEAIRRVAEDEGLDIGYGGFLPTVHDALAELVKEKRGQK